MDWIEIRRSPDRERLGWVRMSGELFVAIDLLGRERTDAVDWLRAEEALEELGIGYLADRYELQQADGSWLPVRITEVSTERISLKLDDWSVNDVNAVGTYFEVPFPAPGTLRGR